MDFDQIYNTQKKVMGRIDNHVDDLERYLKDLSSIVTEINSSWKSDAGEKYYIIKAIQDIRITIGKNIRKYRAFTASSRLYLEQMHNFNTYNGARATGTCVVSNIKAVKSNKTSIIIDTTRIKAVSTKLNSVVKKIDNTMDQINAQVNNVDSMISSTVAGGINVLKGYRNSINAQNDRIRIIAGNINTIAKNYDKAEADIQKVIANIDNIDVDITDEVNVAAEEMMDTMLNSISLIGGFQDQIYIDSKNLKKNLENLFGKLDEYADDYDNIKDMLEAISGEELEIPILSYLIENYSKYKDKYDSVEEFVNAVKSGKIFDDLGDPNTWADILTEACQHLGPETGFLANSANYFANVYGESLEDYFENYHHTGNVITDSFHFWGGFAENVVEDVYEKGKEYVTGKIKKGENLIKSGLNSIYNIADNVSEGLFGIDLDEQYGKLGVNIKDTINNFSIDNIAKGAENLYNKGKKAVNNIRKTIAGWF